MASSSRALYLFIFSLALCHSVNAGMSNVEKIQLAFKQITTASDNLRKETQLINIINAPLQGSKIAEGFAKIISAIAEYTIKINEGGVKNDNSPLPDADAKLVVQSLTTFVQVHQALLNVVIGKHGLLTLIPFFEPIRLSLVSLEATIDAFAFALIAEIPTQKPAADVQFGSLSVTLQVAITTYSSPILESNNLQEMNTTEKIVLAFKQITTASDNLRKEVQLINIINAPLQGFKIAEGFAKIISAIAEYTIKINEGGVKNYNSPLPDADAQIVVQSLTTFVQVHQALLNVVIGKHGLLTLIPFFEPIRLSLVSLEATIDAFAFALIAEIPTQKPAADVQFGSLSVTLQVAITTYSSPLAKLGETMKEIAISA
uniref:Uncharacterized protein n=1 Tax=Physcomitrium patens TaxID=3218 RepID=A0A7I4AQQ5_PHYPA